MWGEDNQKVSMVLFFVAIACAVVLLILLAAHHKLVVKQDNDLAICEYRSEGEKNSTVRRGRN